MEQQIILSSRVLFETQEEKHYYIKKKKLHCPFSTRELHKTGSITGKNA